MALPFVVQKKKGATYGSGIYLAINYIKLCVRVFESLGTVLLVASCYL